MMRTKWLCIFIVLILSGCFSRNEIDALGFVIAVGIDQREDEYVVSTQIANVDALAKDDWVGGKSFLTYQSSGQSVLQAFHQLNEVVPNPIFLSHVKILVLSEEFAKNGMRSILDLFNRYAKAPRNLYIVVSPNAEEMIEANIKSKELPAVSLFNQLNLIIGRTNFHEFLTYNTSESMMIPTITIKDNTFQLRDMAIFKNDKLIGFFNLNETRGVSWVKGNIKNAIFVTDCPEQTQNVEKITMETTGSKSEVTVEKQGNEFIFHIKVSEKALISEFTCSNNEKNAKIIQKLEKWKEEKIQSEINQALQKAKEMKADVFGFGEIVHQSFPSEWMELKNKWEDQFTDIKVKIDVNSKIQYLK